jgi:hypothetical protein
MAINGMKKFGWNLFWSCHALSWHVPGDTEEDHEHPVRTTNVEANTKVDQKVRRLSPIE